MNEVSAKVKSYILSEFLPGENPELLTDSTPLVTGGILDSLAILKMVAFLQDEFQIEIEPREASVEYMDSIADIAALVNSKQA
jgi:acyl carrier protein